MQGDYTTGGAENALFERLQTGLEQRLPKHSDQVIGEAIDILEASGFFDEDEEPADDDEEYEEVS